VALPAGFAEPAAMTVEMAHRAKKRFIENRVVHSRDADFEHTVLLVTVQAFLFRFVKTNDPRQRLDIAEIVAFQALLLGNPFPGDMAVYAIAQLHVRRAQRAGSGRLVAAEQPPCEGHDRKPDKSLGCFPDQSHRIP
jgi:hypothetical protein